MQHKVRNIIRHGEAVVIELQDNTQVIAYQDFRTPKLITGCVANDLWSFPDVGFNQVAGLGEYRETYAIINANTVQLTFYRQSDYDKYYQAK